MSKMSAEPASIRKPSPHTSHAAIRRLRRRRWTERLVRIGGLAAVAFALISLAWLIVSLFETGRTAFYQHFITLTVTFDEAALDPTGGRNIDTLRRANYRQVVQDTLRQRFPDTSGRRDRQELFGLVSSSGAPNYLRQAVIADPALIGQTLVMSVPTHANVDQLLKGHIDRTLDESRRQLSDQQLRWIDQLVETGEISARFNIIFLTSADNRDPELAGIAGALAGSALALTVAFLIAFPVGVGAAIYLEEYAPRNRFTDFIEININNLAAVPSIVFGLLGLAVFLNIMGLPRSIPLVGGMVLALRTFPIIIISTRAALNAVPQSITDGALSVGATQTQAVFHHKLPLAAPGIMTGTIIGMAQALGETAPLLMIGMVAFVTQVPSTLMEPATALPVQIFLWSDSPDRAWEERTSAAILVLLTFLIVMNGAAIYLRNKLDKKWQT